MTLITELVVVLVALLHAYFLVLEMFLWDKPVGLKIVAGVFGALTASRKILYLQAVPGLIGLILVLVSK
jgi:putative membrane protein